MPDDPAAADPKADLNAKQQALADLEQKLKDLNAQAADLRDQVKSLSQSMDEQARLTDSYQNGVDKINKARLDLDDYVALVRPKVEEMTKDKKEKIDAVITEQEAAIAKVRAAATELQKGADSADTALDSAQDDRKQAADKLASLRNILQQANTKISEATTLKSDISAAITAKNNAGAYFLLSEYDEVSKQFSALVVSKDDYQKQIAGAQDAVQKADSAAKTKADAAAKAKDAADAKSKEATAAEANRRKTIVDALKAQN